MEGRLGFRKAPLYRRLSGVNRKEKAGCLEATGPRERTIQKVATGNGPSLSGVPTRYGRASFRDPDRNRGAPVWQRQPAAGEHTRRESMGLKRQLPWVHALRERAPQLPGAAHKQAAAPRRLAEAQPRLAREQGLQSRCSHAARRHSPPSRFRGVLSKPESVFSYTRIDEMAGG